MLKARMTGPTIFTSHGQVRKFVHALDFTGSFESHLLRFLKLEEGTQPGCLQRSTALLVGLHSKVPELTGISSQCSKMVQFLEDLNNDPPHSLFRREDDIDPILLHM